MRVEVAVTVNRPVEDVYDAMADARNEVIWNSQVSETELVSQPPVGQGATFRTVNRGNEYQAVITDYQRPRRMEMSVSGKPMVIDAQMDFEDLGGSTRLSATFDLQPRGFMKVLLPVISPVVRRDFPKQLASFKAFCESRG